MQLPLCVSLSLSLSRLFPFYLSRYAIFLTVFHFFVCPLCLSYLVWPHLVAKSPATKWPKMLQVAA